MNAIEAQDFMRAHGYTRRIHFEEKSLIDPTELACPGQKISLGAGAIEFTRDKPGDVSVKNIFATVFLNRVFFSPTNNYFYAIVATIIPSAHHAAPFGSTTQTWAAIAPHDMKNTLSPNIESGQSPNSGQPIRGTISRLVRHFIPPTP